MAKPRIPTWNQHQTLHWLAEGRKLIIGKWPHLPGNKYSDQERIYWRFRVPQLETFLNPEGYDTLDCGYPKLKRYYMSHLERYGWVEKHENGWTITEEGREACRRYDDYYERVLRSVASNQPQGMDGGQVRDVGQGVGGGAGSGAGNNADDGEARPRQ